MNCISRSSGGRIRTPNLLRNRELPVLLGFTGSCPDPRNRTSPASWHQVYGLADIPVSRSGWHFGLYPLPSGPRGTSTTGRIRTLKPGLEDLLPIHFGVGGLRISERYGWEDSNPRRPASKTGALFL